MIPTRFRLLPASPRPDSAECQTLVCIPGWPVCCVAPVQSGPHNSKREVGGVLPEASAWSLSCCAPHGPHTCRMVVGRVCVCVCVCVRVREREREHTCAHMHRSAEGACPHRSLSPNSIGHWMYLVLFLWFTHNQRAGQCSHCCGRVAWVWVWFYLFTFLDRVSLYSSDCLELTL